MKTKHRIIQWLALLALATLNSQLSTALAQGTTAFTYQGQLRDGGTNANGAYTMIFKLYDAVTSGNQIGTGITNNPTLGNGLFSVNLDFGAGAFNGSARWLDITITNGGVTQTLSPRVQVLPAPYALYAAVAATVTNGAIMNAQLAANAVNAPNIAGGQVVKTLNGLTDNVILAAGANVILATTGNTLQISAASGGGGGNNFVPSIRVFGSSGTFIVPAGVTKIEVELWGGGGGGGSGYSYDMGGGQHIYYTGGGGGAGGYGWNVFNVIPGNSYTVTTPADADGGVHGGTTSFGSLLSATGGSPGANATSSSDGWGGTGGISTGGAVNFTSGDGRAGWVGGQGGGAWRGGSGGYSGSGPGGGGDGGRQGNPGEGASGGAVIVYY